MPEYIGKSLRKIFDMGAIGIGERIERQALCGARQELGDAGHFACEDRVPSFQELGVRELDAEQGAEGGKKLGVADLTLLVALIEFVAPGKSSREMSGLAAGVTGPAGDHLAEVDIEHHAAEIEQ